MKKILGILIFFGFADWAEGQNRKILDSLMLSYQVARHDTAKILILTEIAFQYKGNKPDTCILIARQTLQKSQKINFLKGMAKSLHTLGTGYYLLGNHPLALKYFEQGLQINEKIGDKLGIANSLNNMAIIYSLPEKYPLALEIHQKSLKIREEINHTQGVTVSLNNIGLIYEKQGKYDQALEYYQKSLRLKEQIKDKQGISVSLHNIGQLYEHQQNYDLAYEYYQKSLKIKTDIKDKWGMTYVLNGLALISQHQKNYPKSLEYAQKGLQIAQEIKAIKEISLLSQTLYQTHKLQGNIAKALEYHELFKQSADSVFNLEKTKIIARIEANAQIQAQEKQIEILQKNQEISERKRQFQTNLNYIFVGVLVLTLFFIGLVWRARNQAVKARQALAISHKAIQEQAEALDALNHTKDKIFGIIGHDLRSPIGSLDMLLTVLISQDLSVEEFMDISGELKSSVEHLNFTLNNLLQWAKTQMEGLHIEPKKFDMERLVNENFNFLNHTALDKNITMQNHIPKATMVWADPNHINLVLRNLISNAIKFTPKGGNLILQSKLETDFCEIAIRDTGVGMSAENVAKLFNKTTHFTTYGTANEKGTGLGLLLCQEMIEKNGGIIWAESEVGKGTTFKFRLPLQRDKSL
jgi:signal transduction histidine kinase/Tfp pilus assembly protein PilF